MVAQVVANKAIFGIKLMTTATVLSASGAEYYAGVWSANNSTWAAGSLVNGVGYTQSITIDNTTFPDGTLISWS